MTDWMLTDQTKPTAGRDILVFTQSTALLFGRSTGRAFATFDPDTATFREWFNPDGDSWRDITHWCYVPPPGSAAWSSVEHAQIPEQADVVVTTRAGHVLYGRAFPEGFAAYHPGVDRFVTYSEDGLAGWKSISTVMVIREPESSEASLSKRANMRFP